MAKGSHTTYGGWEPRTCYVCGGRIVKSRGGTHGFYYDHQLEQGFSWHGSCASGPPPARVAA